MAWGGEDSWEFDAAKFLIRSSGVRETEGELQGYRLSPARTLVFSPGPGARVMTTELVISNTGAEFLSVKVRTTNPALFHVTPHTACLEPEKSVTIRIRTTASTDLVAFQQFKLSLLQTEARLAPEQLGAVFSAKNSQGRRIVLRCQVEREAVEPRDLSGGSDDSDRDGHYVPPKHFLSSSDCESDQRADFTTSRKTKAGSWRRRLGTPAKVSKVGRKAAKVSWKTCEVLVVSLNCYMYLFSALGPQGWRLPGLLSLLTVTVVMRGRLTRLWLWTRLWSWTLSSLRSWLQLWLPWTLCRLEACR